MGFSEDQTLTKNHRKKTSRKTRSSDPDFSGYRSGDDRRKHMYRKRKITQEEIVEYLSNKAHRNKEFLWKKKIERDIAEGVPLSMFSKEARKKRQKEREDEIERVKKRRMDWAIQKQQREEELAVLERERHSSDFHYWIQKEHEFVSMQNKLRSDLRFNQGRAKPIDIFHRLLDGSSNFETEPCALVKGLSIQEIEELSSEIQENLDLDKATSVHTEFWQALKVVCNSELAEARQKDSSCEDPRIDIRSSIGADVKNFLCEKSFKQLERLQIQIESELLSGNAKIVEFWEAVVRRLHIHKAEAWLKEFHGVQLHESVSPLLDTDSTEHVVGSYSPRLTHVKESKTRTDAEDDKDKLEKKCMSASKQPHWRHQQEMASNPTSYEDENIMKVMGAVGEDEHILSSTAEMPLVCSKGSWHEKFYLHKPKYLNYVRSGYEWNKYNRVHYDQENPPPKMVQGYKFNIFYPDLLDKSKTPTYVIEEEGNTQETCIIRFHAGPPYEDIAFRIVNKEWECSKKKGFKCIFDHDILRLHINFRRYSYRR